MCCAACGSAATDAAAAMTEPRNSIGLALTANLQELAI